MAQKTIDIAGVRIACCSASEAAMTVITAAIKGHSAGFHFINAYTISLTRSEPQLRRALNSATATFPDGKPLTWIGRAQGSPIAQVRGPELFEAVLDYGRQEGLKHFLLGGTDETLCRLTQNIEERFQGAQIVGSYSPPFRELSTAELEQQDELIISTGAQIVWVGLGTPKQDYEVMRLTSILPVTAAAVGAAFDFTAGTKRVAPAWVSRIGFEWLFRLASEPRRLWRRYTWGNFLFIVQVIRYWSNTTSLKSTVID